MEPTDYLFTVIALLVILVILLVVERQILKKKHAREKAPKAPQPSQELSDFLNDFKQHGYSFVRVDPTNVLLRSPRD
jgi:hypothetical protein